MLEIHGIHKSFGDAHILNGVDLKVNKGDVVAILGPSGSGKTTLLRCINYLETADQGTMRFGDEQYDLSNTDHKLIAQFRRHTGFVFQNYNLLPKTTAVENVELPLMYNSAYNAQRRREAAIEALKAVGLASRLNHKSNQMSGGQMQRVAIARALVNNPTVILADEATGNLDTRTSFEMLVLFQELHARGRTIIFVTHNPEIAQYSSRNIVLRDGKIREDVINTNIKSAAEALAALPVNQDD